MNFNNINEKGGQKENLIAVIGKAEEVSCVNAVAQGDIIWAKTSLILSSDPSFTLWSAASYYRATLRALVSIAICIYR